jgi:protein-S-isoprenylcysteine O-methyltransferase Ste14
MNIDGNIIGNWLADNVVFVLVVLVAIVILTFAITKKPRDAMIAFAICLVAFLLLALGAYWRELGEWLRVTFFGG